MVQKVDKIWLDGEYVDWDQANVHILTHTLHYGLGVFEGIRCYKQADGTSALFRLKEHIKRLYESSQMFWMDIPYSFEELLQVSKDIFKVNKLDEGYLRPIAFVGEGAMGLNAPDNPIRVACIAWPWGAYLGEDGINKGIKAKVSSYTRLALNVNFSKSKACGNYINSILAKREAILAGYEEALMLDNDGYLAEASGENIFVIKDNVVRTPPRASSMLNGITRDCALQILKDNNIEVLEEKIVREDAYIADEIFLTGTAAEITPIRELDNHKIGVGKPGPITQKVQKIFFDAIRGKVDRYKEWLDTI
ncbi:branched chain amino acid aminotransferase [bacterium K02(2017)]|nr:branched chain amino acid aminotransferase [bacterium K02(2017)]